MHAYVGVTNDASLAIKSILQMKKAFRTQVKCIDELSKQNKSLQRTVIELEARINKYETKVKKLESDNMKQGCVVSDLMNETNIGGAFSDPGLQTLTVKSNSDRKVTQLCPTSPTTLKKKDFKRKLTPATKTPPRKSRRKLKNKGTSSV